MSFSHLPRQLQPLARRSEALQMEDATSGFWQIACQLRFPLEENYICTCEQRVDSSRKRVDVKVEHLFKYADNYAPILLVEVKRTGESLKGLESQVRDYGLRLLAEENLNHLWIQTVRGLTYRQWQMTSDGVMHAMAGPDQMGLKEEYLDVRTSEGWAQWWSGTGKMKTEHPLGTAPVLDSQQYLLPTATSSNTTGFGSLSQVRGWEDLPAMPATGVAPSSYAVGSVHQSQVAGWEDHPGMDAEPEEDVSLEGRGYGEGEGSSDGKIVGADDTMSGIEPTPTQGFDLTNGIRVQLKSIRGGRFEFKDHKGKLKTTSRAEWQKHRDLSGMKVWIYWNKDRVFWSPRD